MSRKKTKKLIFSHPTVWIDYTRLYGSTTPDCMDRLHPTVWIDYTRLYGSTTPSSQPHRLIIMNLRTTAEMGFFY
jgi:hypothetical protein